MTKQEVARLMEDTGFPCTYYEFQDIVPPKPFIVWYFPESDDFYADGQNYQKIEKLNIELYTRQKDFAAEAQLEADLRAAGFSWEREEMYIDNESGYEVLYMMEVMLNG